jgi:hypothetical protein
MNELMYMLISKDTEGIKFHGIFSSENIKNVIKINPNNECFIILTNRYLDKGLKL